MRRSLCLLALLFVIRPIEASDTPPKLDGPPRPPEGGPPRPPEGGPPKPPEGGPPKLPEGGPPKLPEGGPPKLPEGGPPKLPGGVFPKVTQGSGGGLKKPEVDPEKAAALKPPGENEQPFSIVKRAWLRKLKDWYTQWQAFDISGIPSKPLSVIEQEQARLGKAIEAASSKKVGPKK